MKDNDRTVFQDLARKADAIGKLDEFLDLWEENPEKAITMWETRNNDLQRGDGATSSVPMAKLLNEMLERLDHLDDSMDFLFDILDKKGLLPPPPTDEEDEFPPE